MSGDFKNNLESAHKLAEKYQLTLLAANENGYEFGYYDGKASPDVQELEFFLDLPCRLIPLYSQPSTASVENNDPKTTFHQVQDIVEPDHSEKVVDDSIIAYIDDVISQGIHARASDIHFEPYENSFRIRFRLDGVLSEHRTIPLARRSAVISRLKVMAGLDIAEKRRPQDGRISVKDRRCKIDLRVSTLPTHFGEKVVLRILDKNSATFDLDRLGFDESNLEIIRRTIVLPFGLILVTGPTGSGKSTTLYSILQELNDSASNIVTIEDPIEYDLPGINQAQARPDLGFNFAAALRTFLRQDPDIIMVGEIRDRETAEMAIRAALTGHLVLSTLHTNDAPSAVVRLLDMGIDPFLIAASVKLVIAQRLVRKLCDACKLPEHYSTQPAWLTLKEYTFLKSSAKICQQQGCPACRHTGFRGRCGLFELYYIDEEIGRRIHQGSELGELRRLGREKGLKTLRQQGIAQIARGVTSVSEVIRETAV